MDHSDAGIRRSDAQIAQFAGSRILLDALRRPDARSEGPGRDIKLLTAIGGVIGGAGSALDAALNSSYLSDATFALIHAAEKGALVGAGIGLAVGLVFAAGPKIQDLLSAQVAAVKDWLEAPDTKPDDFERAQIDALGELQALGINVKHNEALAWTDGKIHMVRSAGSTGAMTLVKQQDYDKFMASAARSAEPVVAIMAKGYDVTMKRTVQGKLSEGPDGEPSLLVAKVFPDGSTAVTSRFWHQDGVVMAGPSPRYKPQDPEAQQAAAATARSI